jgi:hypothetical protein
MTLLLDDPIRYALEIADEALTHAVMTALDANNGTLAGRYAADRTVVHYALETLDAQQKGAA